MSKQEKYEEVLRRLDRRNMDDNEKDIKQYKIIALAIVAISITLILSVAEYYSIDRIMEGHGVTLQTQQWIPAK